MKLLGELHTLRLAARERRSGLAQAHVAQAYIVQRLELALNLRDIPKEGQCSVTLMSSTSEMVLPR